jgi:colicin import membrane protein
MSFIRQHKGAVVWSVMLHIAVVAAVIVGVPWRIERPPVPMAAAVPIVEGVIIDQAAIEHERDKREEAARQERARVQREERQRQQAQEQQRLAEQREQQRVADERRARERAEQQERDSVAAERAEQQRREEQVKAEREAQARREREEADRRAREQAAEQRRRQQAEAELQAQAAAEAAANARALEQYMALIEEDVRRSWNRPLSAVAGLVCVVDVVQAPTGDVLTAKVNPRQCNGDEAVRRSVEDAVRDASPLPQPPTRAVFSRTFTLTFAPDR